ncbi:MAG: DUF4282 domain-containing protein [Acidimicrobiales bacterium]
MITNPGEPERSSAAPNYNPLPPTSGKTFFQRAKEFLSFRAMVTSSVIKVLYTLGAVAITITSIVVFIMSFIPPSCDSYGYCTSRGGGMFVLISVLVLIFGNLWWRLICEWFIIFFSIHDRVRSIEEQLVGRK